MSTLATLAELHRHLGLRADETSDDDRLLTALEAASADLERECGRRFEPRLAAITHTDVQSGDTLSLADDLLELTGLYDAGGAIPLEAVTRIPADGPAALLRLAEGLYFMAGEVTVTGWWGWHDDPAALWAATGQTVQDDPLQAAADQVTVAEPAAFSPGQLLRLNAEVLRVAVVPSTPGPIYVLRAQCGTEAASHAQGTGIESCAPSPDVRDLVLRRAAWLARRAEPLPDALRQPARRWRRERV
ncbi:MAG: phage gp6-like head-tail connector protein [Anaerolineae bacterium]|nr:phage gp6-like head-tail connector protein [Anaerolineae bacterium]